MSLKDNFSQAVKEILKKDVKDDSTEASTQGQKTDLDRYLERTSAPAETKEQTVAQQPTPQRTYAQENAQSTYTSRGEGYQQQSARPAQQEARTSAPEPQARQVAGSPYNDVEEQTVISRNTIIEGNIRSFANVTVEGSIKGDVLSTKNANISGKVIGNLDCNNASMAGSQIQGNVSSKGQVKFDRDSLILGNIAAQYLDMNGKVKGNIDINGKAEFKSDAYIIGDINVSTLTVLEGATISGHVNTTFLQDAPTNVFPEMIAMTDLG